MSRYTISASTGLFAKVEAGEITLYNRDNTININSTSDGDLSLHALSLQQPAGLCARDFNFTSSKLCELFQNEIKATGTTTTISLTAIIQILLKRIEVLEERLYYLPGTGGGYLHAKQAFEDSATTQAKITNKK